MIENVASLLKAFIDQERKKLDKYSLSHGPTIGKMYEGLTSNILDRAIPESLGLHIKCGVIHDGAGNMTGEIDCMLVKGEGEEIPFTDSYKWHIKNVIAVFEVKKSLYSNDLCDAFEHLREVLENYSRYVEPGQGEETFDISSARRVFAETTGIIPPKHKAIDKLPIEKEMIYHTLVMEQLSPVRIILGYHGFRKESTLREALVKFLQENLEQRGFGVGSFPQLIICSKYSLVKMNGQPYTSPMGGPYWNFYASSRTNPVRLILEFIWTRLSRDYGLGGLWGEDLNLQNFSSFLSGKIKQVQDKIGWDYNYTPLKDEILRSEPSEMPWEPCYLNNTQFVIINRLCAGEIERIDDPSLLKYLNNNGEYIEPFVKSLQKTGLVALNDKQLKLTTDQCQSVILPNGKFAAAENNTGRLTRWIEKYMIQRNA